MGSIKKLFHIGGGRVDGRTYSDAPERSPSLFTTPSERAVEQLTSDLLLARETIGGMEREKKAMSATMQELEVRASMGKARAGQLPKPCMECPKLRVELERTLSSLPAAAAHASQLAQQVESYRGRERAMQASLAAAEHRASSAEAAVQQARSQAAGGAPGMDARLARAERALAAAQRGREEAEARGQGLAHTVEGLEGMRQRNLSRIVELKTALRAAGVRRSSDEGEGLRAGGTDADRAAAGRGPEARAPRPKSRSVRSPSTPEPAVSAARPLTPPSEQRAEAAERRARALEEELDLARQKGLSSLARLAREADRAAGLERALREAGEVRERAEAAEARARELEAQVTRVEAEKKGLRDKVRAYLRHKEAQATGAAPSSSPAPLTRSPSRSLPSSSGASSSGHSSAAEHTALSALAKKHRQELESTRLQMQLLHAAELAALRQQAAADAAAAERRRREDVDHAVQSHAAEIKGAVKRHATQMEEVVRQYVAHLEQAAAEGRLGQRGSAGLDWAAFAMNGGLGGRDEGKHAEMHSSSSVASADAALPRAALASQRLPAGGQARLLDSQESEDQAFLQRVVEDACAALGALCRDWEAFEAGGKGPDPGAGKESEDIGREKGSKEAEQGLSSCDSSTLSMPAARRRASSRRAPPSDAVPPALPAPLHDALSLLWRAQRSAQDSATEQRLGSQRLAKELAEAREALASQEARSALETSEALAEREAAHAKALAERTLRHQRGLRALEAGHARALEEYRGRRAEQERAEAGRQAEAAGREADCLREALAASEALVRSQLAQVRDLEAGLEAQAGELAAADRAHAEALDGAGRALRGAQALHQAALEGAHERQTRELQAARAEAADWAAEASVLEAQRDRLLAGRVGGRELERLLDALCASMAARAVLAARVQVLEEERGRGGGEDHTRTPNKKVLGEESSLLASRTDSPQSIYSSAVTSPLGAPAAAEVASMAFRLERRESEMARLLAAIGRSGDPSADWASAQAQPQPSALASLRSRLEEQREEHGALLAAYADCRGRLMALSQEVDAARAAARLAESRLDAERTRTSVALGEQRRLRAALGGGGGAAGERGRPHTWNAPWGCAAGPSGAPPARCVGGEASGGLGVEDSTLCCASEESGDAKKTRALAASAGLLPPAPAVASVATQTPPSCEAVAVSSEMQRLVEENAALQGLQRRMQAALDASAAAASGSAGQALKVQYLKRVRRELEGLRREAARRTLERFALEQCVRVLAVRAGLPEAQRLGGGHAERDPGAAVQPRALSGAQRFALGASGRRRERGCESLPQGGSAQPPPSPGSLSTRRQSLLSRESSASSLSQLEEGENSQEALGCLSEQLQDWAAPAGGHGADEVEARVLRVVTLVIERSEGWLRRASEEDLPLAASALEEREL